jgi:hypothetical protein
MRYRCDNYRTLAAEFVFPRNIWSGQDARRADERDLVGRRNEAYTFDLMILSVVGVKEKLRISIYKKALISIKENRMPIHDYVHHLYQYRSCSTVI